VESGAGCADFAENAAGSAAGGRELRSHP
jgi:hypothetical protein